METKRCSKCRQEKLLIEFHKAKACKDGLVSACKECVVKRQRVYSDRHREEEAARKRRHYDGHREEETARKRLYYKTHCEKERARKRQCYHYEPHYSEEKLARGRAYREAHREEERLRCNAYRKAHPERRAAYNARYRALKTGALGIEYTTAEMIAARCEMWGNVCWICGKPMQAIDHVKPLCKGGTHWPANLRPICKRCNSAKGAKWPYSVPAHRGRRMAEYPLTEGAKAIR